MNALQEVLQIQNANTEVLADRVVESAVLFRDTHDMQHLVHIMKLIDKTLLENGVFLREVLDILEDIEKDGYN